MGQKVLLHPTDARDRGIENASVVPVFNDRGSFEGLAELSEDIMPRVVHGQWRILAEPQSRRHLREVDQLRKALQLGPGRIVF